MILRVAVVLIVTIAAAPQALLACAPAPHMGEEIAIAEESAVIEWDPSTKTEHFTRRATFKGKARDFGFLVPTPEAPALAEVSDGVFDRLEEKTARKSVLETKHEVDFTPLILMPWMARRSVEMVATAAPPVEVLSTQKLAGYEATVLDATDANALRDWLAAHDYATTPDLAEWLDAYIRQHWKITAFKIDKSQSFAARTSAVKMSFRTERPFFPYREPASRRTNAPADSVRSLRIFFLGPERVAGVVGNNERWPGVVTWSDRVEDNRRLTAFMDTSGIRPGTDDLFFSRAAVQSAFIPPPFVDTYVQKIPLPLDAIAVLLGVIALVVRHLRRA